MKKISGLTQLSKKVQLLIKTKMLKNIDFSCFKRSDVVFILLINFEMTKYVTIVGILTFMSRINVVFILLINVEMPTTVTIVGILTFMSRINFMLS